MTFLAIVSLRNPIIRFDKRELFEQLPKDIEHFQRNRESMVTQGKCVALIHLDLDNFKTVNDQFGNSAGDSCIQQVAGLLINFYAGSLSSSLRIGAGKPRAIKASGKNQLPGWLESVQGIF